MMNMLNKIHRWIFEACIIMLLGGGTVTAWANTPYSSVQSTLADNNVGRATPPSYEFRSTTTFTSAVGNSTFSSSSLNEPFTVYGPETNSRKSGWDDDPDDNGIGIVDNPTPVGEPLVLLLLALLYIACRTIIRKQTARQ